MARRLIIDTGVLIASERGLAPLAAVVGEDDDAVIAAITVAELGTGVELATDPQRGARADFLARVLQTLPVEIYGQAAAEAHARLLASVYRSGRPRGAHDLIIAATAVATRRTILTTDRSARYEDLPDVDCLLLR